MMLTSQAIIVLNALGLPSRMNDISAFDYSAAGLLNEHGMADYFENGKTTDFLKLLCEEEFDESSLINCG